MHIYIFWWNDIYTTVKCRRKEPFFNVVILFNMWVSLFQDCKIRASLFVKFQNGKQRDFPLQSKCEVLLWLSRAGYLHFQWRITLRVTPIQGTDTHTHTRTQSTDRMQQPETQGVLSYSPGKVQFDNWSYWFSCLQAFYRIQYHHHDP